MNKHNISPWLIFYIIVSQFVSANVGLVLLLMGILYFLVKGHFVLRFTLPGKNIYLSMFLIAICVGFIYFIKGRYNIYLVLKHAYYFITPALYWVLACQMTKTGATSRSKTINSFLIAAILYSIYDVAYALMTLVRGGYSSLNQFRHIIGTSNFLALIGLYILLSYKKEIHLQKWQRIIAYSICLIAVIIHFSRSIFIDLIIFILFSGIIKDYKKMIKIGGPIVLGTIALIVFLPNEVQQLIGKVLNTSDELQAFSGSWTRTSIVQNWRGYEMFCEMTKFKNASLIEKILGGGFGSSLDVFGYAYLVTNEQDLSVLHNGYFTELMIGGLIGVILNFLWYLKLYFANKRIVNINDRMAYRCLVIVMAVSTYFVKGPLYSSMSIFFFYLALFYYSKGKLTEQ